MHRGCEEAQSRKKLIAYSYIELIAESEKKAREEARASP